MCKVFDTLGYSATTQTHSVCASASVCCIYSTVAYLLYRICAILDPGPAA